MISNIQNSYYPTNLSYLVKKISAYSHRTVKLMPISANSQVLAGAQINVDLPSNSIVDIDSFQMFFKGVSKVEGTNALSRMPRLIEQTIERISIEINGVSIQNDTPYLNQQFTILAEMQH